MRNDIAYSIIIPVYNSAESLIKIVTMLDQVFAEQIHEKYEIIFINDYSPNPESWKTIVELAHKHKNITGIQLQRNFGKAGAQICGFEHMSGQYAIVMDDDLQHHPEAIPLLTSMKQHDVVMARYKEKKHSLAKRVTSEIKSWFDYYALGRPKNIVISAFALIKQNIIKDMLRIRTAHPIIVSMILFVTKDIVNVEVTHHERIFGESKFGFQKRWALFKNLLFNNSNVPIRLFRYIGMVTFLMSMCASAYYLTRKLMFGINAPGFTTLVLLILVFGGIVILEIGVLGEYIYRLLENIENKPSYIFREMVTSEEEIID